MARPNFFQLARLCRCVFVLAEGADAKGADDFVTVARRDTERAADAGLARARFGHAAGVGLQIANGDRGAARDDLSGNALADRNGFDNLQHLGRQTHLGHQVKRLLFRVEPVNRARLGTKMLEHLAQRFLQNNLAWAAAFQERDDLFIQFVHTEIATLAPEVYWIQQPCSACTMARASHMAGGVPGCGGGSGGKTS